MSSTPIPALVAVLAPALARTKQSWKTNQRNICIKSEKACQKQAFFSFFWQISQVWQTICYLCLVL